MRRFKLPSWLGSRLGLALTLTALSLALLVAGQRGWAGPLPDGLAAVLAPAQAFVHGLYTAAVNTIYTPGEVETLRARNAELEQRVAELTDENVRLHEAEAQLRVVSALLDYARSQPTWRYITADVVGRDESLFLRFVLLSKGSRDGVARGMVAVTDRGLVGTVTEVTATASKVLLITDPSSAVNVRLQSSRAEGVVTGQESGELRLNFISVDVDMQAGERVLTSGLGGQFPPGLVVGTVASVRRRTFDVFQEADVKSSVEFNRLETVLIIANFEQPELRPLRGTPTPVP